MTHVTEIDVKNALGATKTVATLDALIALVGTLADAAETDPAAASATLLQVLRGVVSRLSSISGYVDGLETLNTALNGYVDGLETLVTSSNTKLDTLHTDIATTLAGLITTLNGYVDQLEGYVDGVEGALGVSTGTAVITDANGTIQQYLRGLIKQWIAGTLVIGAGSARIGKVGGDADIVGGAFNRPSDTNVYASGDLVANSVTAGSVTPITITASLANDGKVAIPRVRLKKSGTSLTNASFRVHLYKNSPTPTNGDNGAWLTTESTYIGAFDVTMDRAFSDGAKGNGAPLTGNFALAEMASGTMTIFALIEARAAYTPVSGETFTLACECIQFS